MLEVCVDVPRQSWEPRLLIFDLVPDAVAEIVDEEMADEPHLDARLTGCDRWTLQPDPTLGAFLCYLADDAERSEIAGFVADKVGESRGGFAHGADG